MFTKTFSLTLAAALLLAACSENDTAAPAAPTQTDAASAAPKTPVTNPECTEVFTGNHSMVYDKDSLTINKSKCREFTVVVRNIGHLPRRSRGHNFVIAKDSDEKAILSEGIAYGAQNNFLKPDDNRVVAYTTLAGGGEEQSVTFPTDRFVSGNNYVYFCSFLGHRKMRGKVHIVE